MLRVRPLVGGLCEWGGGASLHGWSSAASLCARTRGEPSSARCEQRLSDGSPLARAIPCAPAVSIHDFCTRCRRKRVAGLRRLRAEVVARPPASSGESPHAHTRRRKRGRRRHRATRIRIAFSVCAPTRSAASRAGMAGWAGEGGGRFGERREYEAPTLPSTPRQHGMARHYKSQPRNSTPCQYGLARHHTRQAINNTHNKSQARNGSPPHTPAKKRQPQHTCLLKTEMAAPGGACTTPCTSHVQSGSQSTNAWRWSADQPAH